MAKTTKATTAKKPAVVKSKSAATAKKAATTPPAKKATAATTKKVTAKKDTAAKAAKPATKTTAAKKAAPKAKALTPVAVIAQAMLDKKAQQVVSLDLSKIDTAICDYFVICHADATTQVVAIADNVEKDMFEHLHEWPVRVQGKENAFWIILDYSDVVVHIFQTEYRQFYRLEELWADAGRVLHNEEPKKQTKK